MDVTRENFTTVCDDIAALIKTARYVAVDLEMSGIAAPGDAESPVHSPQELYEFKREAAARYAIIQVGLCLVHDGPDGRPVMRPFNVFVFPAATNNQRGLPDVAMSPSAVAFLRQHGMDFQRWVTQGVPCPTAAAAVALEAEAAAPPAVAAATVVTAGLSEKEKAWVAESTAAAHRLASGPDATGAQDVLPVIESDAACSALRAAVGAADLAVQVRFRGARGRRNAVLAKQPSGDSPAVTRKKREAVTDSLGFQVLWRALVEARVPVVGHHCFVDWLFLLQHCDAALPARLEDFKARLHDLFPTVVDTKVVATAAPPERFASSSLGGLYGVLSAPPSATVDPRFPLGFHAYAPSVARRSKAHEAGYDALMTAHVYLQLLQDYGAAAVGALHNQLQLFNSPYRVALGSGEDLCLASGRPVTPDTATVLLDHSLPSGAPVDQLLRHAAAHPGPATVFPFYARPHGLQHKHRVLACLPSGPGCTPEAAAARIEGLRDSAACAGAGPCVPEAERLPASDLAAIAAHVRVTPVTLPHLRRAAPAPSWWGRLAARLLRR